VRVASSWRATPRRTRLSALRHSAVLHVREMRGRCASAHVRSAYHTSMRTRTQRIVYLTLLTCSGGDDIVRYSHASRKSHHAVRCRPATRCVVAAVGALSMSMSSKPFCVWKVFMAEHHDCIVHGSTLTTPPVRHRDSVRMTAAHRRSDSRALLAYTRDGSAVRHSDRRRRGSRARSARSRHRLRPSGSARPRASARAYPYCSA
jgi:hypothetical protein